jgi:hypothetical protein
VSSLVSTDDLLERIEDAEKLSQLSRIESAAQAAGGRVALAFDRRRALVLDLAVFTSTRAQ